MLTVELPISRPPVDAAFVVELPTIVECEILIVAVSPSLIAPLPMLPEIVLLVTVSVPVELILMALPASSVVLSSIVEAMTSKLPALTRIPPPSLVPASLAVRRTVSSVNVPAPPFKIPPPPALDTFPTPCRINRFSNVMLASLAILKTGSVAVSRLAFA